MQRKDHFLSHASSALPCAAQDAVGLFHCKGVFLVDDKLLVPKDPKALHCQAIQSPECTDGWNYSYPNVRLRISHCWALWGTPLPNSPAYQGPSQSLWCNSHSSWFCITCKLAVAALCSTIQVVNEEPQQYWPHYHALKYNASELAFSLILCHISQPLDLIVQTIFNSPHYPFIYPTLCQLVLLERCERQH